MVDICKSIQIDILEVQALANFLKVEYYTVTEDTKEDLLFNVLYNWHRKNPSADKPYLAKRLHDFGLIKEAYILCPTCKFSVSYM